MGVPIAFAVRDMGRSELYCENCDTKFVVFRKRGSLRGNGHIKHVWCHRCKSVTPHIEVQST